MDNIELVAIGVKGNVVRRYNSVTRITYPVALPAQKKGPVVDVSGYGHLRVTLNLEHVPGGAPLQEPLTVTLECAESENGPWQVLHALTPLHEPGTVVADVVVTAHFVRGSWYWHGSAGLIFGIGAVASPRVAAAPAVPAHDRLAALSDKKLERMAEEAGQQLKALDAEAKRLGEENRALNDRFKAQPTPQLAGELAAGAQRAENARAEYRAFYTSEAFPLECELDRRAGVRRLRDLRLQLASMPDWRGAGDKLGAAFAALLGTLALQLGELDRVVSARDALLDEANALEGQIGEAGTEHKPTDRGNLHKLMAERAAERFAHLERGLGSEIRAWMRLAQHVAVPAEPAQAAAAGAPS